MKNLRNKRNDITAINRLKKLVKKLEKVKDKKFDMEFWSNNRESEDREISCNLEACGTTACALGWATTVFPKSLKLCIEKDNIYTDVKLRRKEDIKRAKSLNIDTQYPLEVGQYFFKISHETASELFLPDYYPHPTKKNVINRINRIINAIKNKKTLRICNFYIKYEDI